MTDDNNLEIQKEITLDEVLLGLEHGKLFYLSEQGLDIFVPDEGYRHVYQFDKETKTYNHYFTYKTK